MLQRKWYSAAVAALFAAASLSLAATPAAAQHHRDRGGHHGGGHHSGAPHYSGHQYNHHRGHYAGRYHGPRHYYYHGGRRYYGYGWGYDPWGAAAAVGIIGLAAGAIAAGAASNADAVAYCEQRYRSYDPRSGTYLGYDGYRHPCP